MIVADRRLSATRHVLVVDIDSAAEGMFSIYYSNLSVVAEVYLKLPPQQVDLCPACNIHDTRIFSEESGEHCAGRSEFIIKESHLYAGGGFFRKEAHNFFSNAVVSDYEALQMDMIMPFNIDIRFTGYPGNKLLQVLVL